MTGPSRLNRRGTVLGLLALSGLLALFGSAQSWFVATGADPTTAAADPVRFSGAEATGGLSQALGAVLLAGVLLSLVLAVRGRRVLALLLVLTGSAMVLLGVLRTPPSAAAVRIRVRQVSLAEDVVLTGTGWPWLYLVAGVLAVAGAVLLWLGSPSWARRGDRFRRPGEGGPATVDPADPDADPAIVWRAQDAGLDPTGDRGSEPADDPDVHPGGPADRMGTGKDQSARRQDGDQ